MLESNEGRGEAQVDGEEGVSVPVSRVSDEEMAAAGLEGEGLSAGGEVGPGVGLTGSGLAGPNLADEGWRDEPAVDQAVEPAVELEVGPAVEPDWVNGVAEAVAAGEAAAAVRRLDRAIGSGPLMDVLAVDRSGLEALKEGQVEMTQGMVDRMVDLCNRMEQFGALGTGPAAGAGSGGFSLAPGREEGRADELLDVGVDLDQDGVVDIRLGLVSPRWSEGEERKRMSLRSARGLAVMTQFRLGITWQESVAAFGLVTQIELALIAYFHESVPDPGAAWDNERRAREIEKRLRRLRWVDGEQAKEYGGWKGVWNRLQGKAPVTGKELYMKMLDEADDLMSIVDVAPGAPGAMEQVLRYSGVDLLEGRDGARKRDR